MGLFQNYKDADESLRYHNSWYGDHAHFVLSTHPWFHRGSSYSNGAIAGQFYFYRYTGDIHVIVGSRLVLSPQE